MTYLLARGDRTIYAICEFYDIDATPVWGIGTPSTSGKHILDKPYAFDEEFFKQPSGAIMRTKAPTIPATINIQVTPMWLGTHGLL